MKVLRFGVFSGVCLLGAVAAVGAVAPSGLTPNGTTVSLHTDEQKAFLGLSRQERRDVYTDRSYRTTLAGDRSGAPKPVTLSWSGDGPATVAVSRSAGGKPVFVATVTGGTVAVSNLEMNASYVWTVANAVGSAVGRFSTEDLAPRLLRDPNPARYADEDVGGALVARIHGVRDLGGRLGLDGRRVRQGRIIRTSQFNDASGSFVNDTNRGFWRDELGVRTDLDLRKLAELGGITASPLGTDVKFVNCAIGRYENFFEKSSTNAFRKAFAVLLDEANYPVAVHCLDGQDRTGIFAFLVNALLDVDEDELLKDWEATAFWNSAGFFQHDGLIDTFLADLAVKFPGETVQDQASAFIRSLGFTAAQIAAFRELMLEPGDPFAPGDEGGVNAYRYAEAGVTYQVLHFTDTAAAQSWTVPAGVTSVDVLAVGGGGAGGAAKYNKAYCGAGGGGAGAFIYKEGLAVAPGQVFTVKVGAGGLASTTATPGDGEASVVVNETANISLTAAGGGHGGGCVVGAAQGGNGGCGGGGYGAKSLGGDPVGNGRGTIGGTGAKVFKSDGTTVRGILGGGGGGAGFAGPSARSYDGCSGGDGLFCRITGVSVCYGGGGGGGAAQANNGNTGNGGAGGGGKGGDEGVGVAGTDGLGGGGGGGSSKGSSSTTVFAGGNGGSGVVIIRYVVDMGTAAVPSNLSPNGTMVNVHNAKQKEFLAMSESELRSKFADSSWRGTISKQGDCLPLPVTFSWTGGGYNTVKVYNADGSLFLEKAVRGSSTELWGFDIGTNYTWEVVNSVKGASARAAFTTELEVPRMFRDPNFDEVTFDGSSTCTRKLTGVINMRELGGYAGLDGKRIRTGRLIRTARITENSLYSRDPGRIIGDSFVKTDATRAFWLDTLGIRTQVDLRDPDEYGSDYIGNETGVFGSSVRWVKFTTANDEQAVPCYDRIFTEQGKANYKLLLDEMLNPANHPIVFHCSAGKDRTGTVAYILEAILGVSDEDKFRDWVALVLSSTDTQFSPTEAYDPLVAGFGAYEGETQNDKVVSFVKSLGVTEGQIETFRAAMLEGSDDPEPAEEHPYTVTWTGAAGDQKWATAKNWDKELTDVDTARFADDATAIVATATPGAALTVESGKTVTIRGTVGVTANFTGATAEYQALADGATLIADGGDGFRLTSDAGFRFGNDTTYRVVNGCYSKLSGLRIGDSKNVRFETDASHLKFDIASVLSAGSEIVCRTMNASGLLELGTAKLSAGTVSLAIENGAETTVSDLQDNGAVVALGVGTNAVFRVTGGEDHLFHLGATAGSSLEFHGSSPKVQLSYCNSVKLGANLTVRLTPEAGWSNWTLIQRKDATSTAGTCTIDAGIRYVIDTRALKGVKDAFSFYLYKNGSTSDTHAIAVPAADNVTLVGPCADGFEATFSKPDDYKLLITLTPKKVLQPTAKPTVQTGLAYTGSEQTGVASGANYVLEGDASGTDARAYAVTATPKEGYCWDDGSVDSIDLEWSIAQAENAWTTLPTVTPDSFEEGSAGEVDLDVGESRFGEPQADLSAEQIAALTAGTHVITVTVPATGNWKGLETTVSVTVTAADPSVWFDGVIGGKAHGGSWTMPLPDRVELTDARYVLAGPDEPFAFTATEAKAADVRTNLIVRTVLRFSEPAADGFPEVQPDQKMAATVCTFGGEARYCVLARDSEASPATNRWVDTGLAATTDKDVALVVTIVKNAQGVTTAEYGFDGETYGPVEVVAEGEISRFSYSGTGEVAALAGQWNELAPIVGPTVDGEPVDPAEVFAMARSNKPIEYPSAPELAGEVGAQTIVFGGVSVPVPRHYTATLSGNTVTLALNDFARPVLEDSDDDKKAIAVGETTVTLHVGQRIDGLYYRVVATAALGGEWTPVTEFLPVGDFTVDRKATDASAFYKIEVSDVDIGCYQMPNGGLTLILR